MIKNPLGVGYDKVNTMINGYASDGDGGAGAVLFCTGAALGILTIASNCLLDVISRF